MGKQFVVLGPPRTAGASDKSPQVRTVLTDTTKKAEANKVALGAEGAEVMEVDTDATSGRGFWLPVIVSLAPMGGGQATPCFKPWGRAFSTKAGAVALAADIDARPPAKQTNVYKLVTA